MKVLNSLRTAKERHPDCQIVKRKGRLYVICNLIHVLRPFRVVRKNVDSKFDGLTIFV